MESHAEPEEAAEVEIAKRANDFQRALLSTNYGEPSVTSPDLQVGVDLGRAGTVREHDDILEVRDGKATVASHTQRMGRGGHVQRGHYVEIIVNKIPIEDSIDTEAAARVVALEDHSEGLALNDLMLCRLTDRPQQHARRHVASISLRITAKSSDAEDFFRSPEGNGRRGRLRSGCHVGSKAGRSHRAHTLAAIVDGVAACWGLSQHSGTSRRDANKKIRSPDTCKLRGTCSTSSRGDSRCLLRDVPPQLFEIPWLYASICIYYVEIFRFIRFHI